MLRFFIVGGIIAAAGIVCLFVIDLSYRLDQAVLRFLGRRKLLEFWRGHEKLIKGVGVAAAFFIVLLGIMVIIAGIWLNKALLL